MMSQKRLEMQRKEQKRIAELTELAVKIQALGGVWMDANQVDAGLSAAGQGFLRRKRKTHRCYQGTADV